MQSTNWAPEHSDALRQYLAAGLSYAEIADAINAKFKTAYSRNAAISRAKRLGLAGSKRSEILPQKLWSIAVGPRLHRSRERHQPEFGLKMPMFESTETAELRRADVVSRRLSLLDLEPGDCRYPYGGDAEGEAITFCGHPRHPGSSYCWAHFHLSVGPGTASKRTAVKIALKLLEAV